VTLASKPRSERPVAADLLAGVDRRTINAVLHGNHADPHRVLGAHPAHGGGAAGVVVRAFHPDAVACDLLVDGDAPRAMAANGGGLFAVAVAGATLPMRYRLRFKFADGVTWERDDPYRFLPTVGELDLHLFGKGDHRRLWEVLGAHPRTIEGVEGTSFAVWAPNARRVSVVGDFNNWDGRVYPMRSLGASGVFELFVPGVHVGSCYKYEIKTGEGHLRLKTDPYAQAMEMPPHTASRVTKAEYEWSDELWMRARATRDWAREPMAIYEVHIGSWARVPEEADRWLTYREVAERLVEHCRRYGFTHVELMPLAEHAFYASWGYQVTGYYAPTARYGSPDDLRYLVDHLHRAGIGVLMDWVPAHFPRDDFSLRRFDGTALYEHDDPRRGEHPDWGTLIFNYGRAEVRNFLLANALYWLREFHLDGLRVDAVASMLYLDYSRREGEWLPNEHGGRDNVEAVEFLRACNTIVHAEVPGAITVAEESTAWPGVSKPASQGGLGFSFKWNMGWMHDTLLYFAKDPIYRSHHQDNLTFAMIYEYSERFINPLSHDEVVHGKGSLLGKMPGDPWQKFANLRLLLTYMYTRPGKQLLFMGTELAPDREWAHDHSLDWHLMADPMRAKFSTFLEELGRMYLATPALWRADPDPEGYAWIDASDARQSVMSYRRRAGEEEVVVVLNLTPTPRSGYRIGAPRAGRWVEIFSSDDSSFGGSDVRTLREIEADPVAMHGFTHSLRLELPPLGALVLRPA
jgi:1,4-alpha-glucan branching enzyme